MIFDEVEIDRAKRRRGFLQSRTGLNLDKLIFEIAARKGGNDLAPLLWCIFVISNRDDVHQDTCVGKSYFGPHVLWYARRSM